jgi:hypothetical protein
VRGPRRHLTSKDRAIIAVESLPLYEAEAAERLKARQKHGGETAGRGRPKGPDSSTQKVAYSYQDRDANTAVAQAAKAAGTNRESVRRAKKMKKEEPERYEQAKRNMGKKRGPNRQGQFSGSGVCPGTS